MHIFKITFSFPKFKDLYFCLENTRSNHSVMSILYLPLVTLPWLLQNLYQGRFFFCPFGLICFTDLFLTWNLILYVGQILPTLFCGHIWSNRLLYKFAQKNAMISTFLHLNLMYIKQLFSRYLCQQLLRCVESRQSKPVRWKYEAPLIDL